MKKILFLLIVLLCSNLQAQFMALPGIKAGANYATLYGDGEGKGIIGFHIGGIAEIQIKHNYFFQTEFLYSMQGANNEVINEIADYTNKTTLHYLNVPLILKAYLNGYEDGWFLEVGSQIGFLVRGKQTIEGTYDGNPIYEEADFSESYSATDLAACIGIGNKVYDSNFFFSIRYNHGLTDINETEDSDLKNYNGAIQVSIGLIFD